MWERFSIETIAMNDYDFGKYYRRNNKQAIVQKTGNVLLNQAYRKISVALVAGLILFFAGLMTGISFQSKKLVQTASVEGEQETDSANVVNSADVNPDRAVKTSRQTESAPRSEVAGIDSETAHSAMKKTLMDPENEYIILARKYGDNSKDRALYYAGVLNKITKDYNFEVVPSIRGKSIKLYVGPMKGKKMAEKMLSRVKSIPEFANSAILYKK